MEGEINWGKYAHTHIHFQAYNLAVISSTCKYKKTMTDWLEGLQVGGP